MSETTPLIYPVTTPRDSHPIYLRACHSPWRLVNQKVLVLLRLAFVGYLSAVFGIGLKYKLETEDEHSKWRVLFQFSSVSFLLLWAYHGLTALWTTMHLLFPRHLDEDPDDCHGHQTRTKIINFLSPSNRDTCRNRRFLFSLFYTVTHVFAFMNTIIFWGALVPAGHGGFKLPDFPHHGHEEGGQDSPTATYDPDKGLFEEDDLKPFAILNIWTITSVIGLIEIFFLNSIRRQRPVTLHTVGVMVASGMYITWALLGKLITGHAGLFFLDPELMGEQWEAVIAAALAFISLSPGIFSYMYGLIAMRETMTATHHTSS